jgi:hypothetical protein
MAPWSALPDHLNPHKNPKAWIGTDTEWKRWLKGLFAFGPRAKEEWARFRELPITLFKSGGEGFWRYEDSTGSKQFTHQYAFSYLSRIQPWIRWSVFLNWPLFFHFHVIYRKKDVLKYPETDTDELNIGKAFVFDAGFKRDGDSVYWLTAFLGGRFE